MGREEAHPGCQAGPAFLTRVKKDSVQPLNFALLTGVGSSQLDREPAAGCPTRWARAGYELAKRANPACSFSPFSSPHPNQCTLCTCVSQVTENQFKLI